MSLAIKDGTNAAESLKTTLDGGEHVTHHNIDACALPTGAATAAAQTTHTTKLTSIETAVQAVQTQTAIINGSTQQTNFSGSLMVFSVAAGAAAAAITPAPGASKKLAIDRIEFFETDAGAGTGDGKLAAADLLIVVLQEETSGTIIFRRSIKIVAAGDQQNRWFEIDCPRSVKLPTADKKLFIRFYAFDSGGVAKARNLTGQCNVWFHDES